MHKNQQPVRVRPGSSYADVASRIDDDEGFQIVHNRRRDRRFKYKERHQTSDRSRNDVIYGTNKGAATTISGVRRDPTRTVRERGGVFISRLKPTTSVADLQDYVFNKINIHVKCIELKSRHDSYKSFRILIEDNIKNKLLVPTIWPLDVLVRQFFD